MLYLESELINAGVVTVFFFFSSRRRHTRWNCDWSSDVCSSDLAFSVPQVSRGPAPPLADRDLGHGEGRHLMQAVTYTPSVAKYVAGRAKLPGSSARSEERRVGKEGRSRWSAHQ